jgi:hypothetical protein
VETGESRASFINPGPGQQNDCYLSILSGEQEQRMEVDKERAREGDTEERAAGIGGTDVTDSEKSYKGYRTFWSTFPNST